jgi:arginase
VNIDILLVGYDSGYRRVRMGAGPDALIAAGLPERLRSAGHAVTCTTAELPPECWTTEIRTAFDLIEQVAEHVRRAKQEARLPVILSGNCNVAVGVVAGLGPTTSVLWCDAHADFNTPETTRSGFLDGMALAMMTGRCWTGMSAQVPGFSPIPESSVILAGARELDEGERTSLESSDIRRVAATAIGGDLGAEVRRDVRGPLYVHIDADVLDVSEGCANNYAVAGGASGEQLISLCHALGAPDALTISAYDPAADVDGRIRTILLRAIDALVKE